MSSHPQRSIDFDPHRLQIEALFRRLAASPDGLTSEEADARLRHDGPNVISEQPQASLSSRIRRHLTHRFAILLWAGALLAFLGERFSPGEGMALIAAALAGVVLLNAGFSFWQEVRVEHAMAAFRGMLSTGARAIRDGAEVELEARQVVAGDIIVLREGDRVPADARLIAVQALKVDNSPLTGESEPQLRTTEPSRMNRLDSRNLVFSGTLVTAGTGQAVVYATGNATELGHIAGITRTTTRRESPIRRELDHFIQVITRIALALGAVFFVAGWAIGNPPWTNLVFAIGIIVANVPEGLLPTVTLALAVAGRKMADRHALLKTLESAETLGSATVICTDKTGTLTLNEMRVVALLGPGGSWIDSALPSAELESALTVMALCNNATCGTGPDGIRTSGDPTETALLRFAESTAPGAVENFRDAFPRVYERPFDSATREMATIHRRNTATLVGAVAKPAGVEAAEKHQGLEAFLKGAPEVVIEQCSQVWNAGGVLPITDAAVTRLKDEAARLARQGHRVLALARKTMDAEADLETVATGQDYAFAGLVAIDDPPRPEVAGAVRKCRAAGIRVIVVSGDHPLTVEAIARKVDILADDPARIHTGEDLEGWSAPALRRALGSGAGLFARTSPLDKLRIVTALQEMGHVVAVTGDGVNDAPALKRADIGVAMGQSGTDVAREAADMVLMDDNFATIVAAVEEGRVIYGNIRRFIGYVLTSNVPEILPYVAFVLLGIPLPMPVMLILAVDLGTDLAPAVALAAESAEVDVMRQPPRPRSERLLSPGLLLSAYLLWGMVEAAAAFAAYFWVLFRGGWTWGVELALTDPLYGRAIGASFAAIVLCQVANVLVWRTTGESVFVKGLLGNRAVLAGVALELFLLWFIVESAAGQALFGTASLPPDAWLVPLPFALSMVAIGEGYKRWNRRWLEQRATS